MVGFHTRYIGQQNFVGANPRPFARTVDLKLASPGNTMFLNRTRMFLEFRIAAYSQTDTQEPPGEWWDNIACFAGLWYDPGPTDPLMSDDPIGGVNSDQWVQWAMLNGSVESVIITPNGWHRWTYVFRLPGGVGDSFARRKPDKTSGGSQYTYLSWNFFDSNNFINRQPGSFDVVYNLEVKWAVDHFWQFYP